MKYILILILLSCKPSTPPVKDAVVVENPVIQTEIETDSTQIVGQIIGFIKWYRDHYDTVRNIRFTGLDAHGNYQVNISECNKYLDHLLSSGFLSKEYQKAWSKYFESQVENFKQNPQNEGPPEGFDFDLVFMTQEPEIVWNSVDKLTFKIHTNEEQKMVASVVSNASELDYEFEMGKENGVWKIDYIATMNYD